LPARAIASIRALRAETIASSDIANTPFKATSARMIATSIQGKGGSGAMSLRTSLPYIAGAHNRHRPRCGQIAAGTIIREHELSGCSKGARVMAPYKGVI
jgi:hypothetical protein